MQRKHLRIRLYNEDSKTIKKKLKKTLDHSMTVHAAGLIELTL